MVVGHPVLEPPVCPECGSQDTVPIMYGCASPETFEAIERGEIPGAAIGGCVGDVTNPVWACPVCKHRW
jgi:hypothetical protein